jgi:hypothetical protein
MAHRHVQIEPARTNPTSRVRNVFELECGGTRPSKMESPVIEIGGASEMQYVHL